MSIFKIKEELINENKDLDSAVGSIRAIIGNPIHQMYRDIKVTAEKYSRDHPDMYNFQRIAGAAKSRWVDKFGNQLKNDIRKMAENVPPKSGRILKDALLKRPATYKQFMLEFIPALAEVGRKINDGSLVSIAKAWTAGERDLQDYIESLIDDGVDIRSEKPAEPKKQNLVGGQNQQAEKLINDVINRIPKQYQHQVRMKVAKSENKLVTLQQELQKLGVKV